MRLIIFFLSKAMYVINDLYNFGNAYLSVHSVFNCNTSQGYFVVIEKTLSTQQNFLSRLLIFFTVIISNYCISCNGFSYFDIRR